ncbi:MAG TPA: PH domain-containing protein [Alphaproteobacteria bacterium]|nr:PH domain-containing protein [Alphaproteobacteria bacterium]
MNLPPLARTKHLSRLLGPDEVIIYTGKLHPFHGIGWWLGFLFLATLAWYLWAAWQWQPYLLVPALICLLIYRLPFHNTEIAVTTHRLLLRYGRFRVHSDEIDGSHIDHYQLHQTPFSSFFHYGTVILNLRAGRDIYYLKLVDIWHPLTLFEALNTLNPLFQPKRKETVDESPSRASSLQPTS